MQLGGDGFRERHSSLLFRRVSSRFDSRELGVRVLTVWVCSRAPRKSRKPRKKPAKMQRGRRGTLAASSRSTRFERPLGLTLHESQIACDRRRVSGASGKRIHWTSEHYGTKRELSSAWNQRREAIGESARADDVCISARRRPRSPRACACASACARSVLERDAGLRGPRAWKHGGPVMAGRWVAGVLVAGASQGATRVWASGRCRTREAPRVTANGTSRYWEPSRVPAERVRARRRVRRAGLGGLRLLQERRRGVSPWGPRRRRGSETGPGRPGARGPGLGSLPRTGRGRPGALPRKISRKRRVVRVP
jgi:hypothetical protein